jgi:predicted DNA-binding protein
MSDMASDRITIRVPKTLGKQLHGRSRESGETPSTIVRLALEAYLNACGSSASAFDVAAAAGLIGCANGLSKDLSTNRRHMEGFGKRK